MNQAKKEGLALTGTFRVLGQAEDYPIKISILTNKGAQDSVVTFQCRTVTSHARMLWINKVSGLIDKMTKTAQDPESNPELVRAAVKELCAALTEICHSWDATDGNKTPMPLSALEDVIAAQFPFAGVMLSAVLDWTAPNPEARVGNLGRPSS